MRSVVSILVLVAASNGLAAAPPSATAWRYRCPSQLRVSGLWITRRGEVQAHVVVAHQNSAGRASLDGVTYVVDQRLTERLEEDFGPFTPLVLRRLEQRLMALPGPPRRALVLQAAGAALEHIHRQLPYRVQPGLMLMHNTELWVYRLALELRRRVGHVCTVTSGTRRPRAQAAAMYGKLVRRTRYRSLYKKRELAEEIRQAFLKARRQRARRPAIIAAMTAVIEQQMRRGEYVSAHLKRVAVDLRSYDMPRRVRRALQRAAAKIEGVQLLRERRPPHFHVEVPAEPALPGCPHLDLRDPASRPASTSAAGEPTAGPAPLGPVPAAH